jgi:uncharacterized membrane protein YoaK (UPF0700 family)
VINGFLSRGIPGISSKPPEDAPWQYGTVWVTYLAGAIVCGLIYSIAGGMALLLPVASIAAVIALGPRRC